MLRAFEPQRWKTGKNQRLCLRHRPTKGTEPIYIIRVLWDFTMSGIHRSLVWRSCDLVIVSMHVPKCQDDLSRKCNQCEQHEPMTMKPKVTHYYIITGAPGFGVAELSREQRNVAF